MSSIDFHNQFYYSSFYVVSSNYDEELIMQWYIYVLDLYYGGEALALEQPQAYTCPYCNRMGFTDTALMEHVTAEHADTTLAVSRLCKLFTYFYYAVILN